MTIKIVQLTDSHLLEDENLEFKGYKVNQSFLECLKLSTSLNPDLLLLTGDISEDGSMGSYQRVKTYLEATRVPYAVLPGNHDNVALLKEVFKENCFLDQVYTIQGWDLFLLNSVVPNKIHGYFSFESFVKLQEVLTKGTAPIAVFLHHHPVYLDSPVMDQCALSNPSEFWQLLLPYKQKVKFVCCGHVHQEHASLMEGINFFTTPSTSMQFKPKMEKLEFDQLPAGIRCFEFSEPGDFTTRIYRLKQHE